MNSSSFIIRGSGFNTTPNMNMLSMSTGTGTIRSATDTELIVDFTFYPISTGPLTVNITNNLGSVTGVQVATIVSATSPTITSNTDNLSINAASITITGIGFNGLDPSNNIVTFFGAGWVSGTVTSATSTTLVINFTNPPSTGSLYAMLSNFFGSASSVQVATIIQDPSCFNEGTKILYLNKNFEDEYIQIENLRPGDLVKTYLHGYRRIEYIGKGILGNNPNIWHSCMYIMKKTEKNMLLDDLVLTGGHALLVDNLSKEELSIYKNQGYFGGSPIKIDDKYLLLSSVSKLFKKITDKLLYTYYHLTFENNGDNDQRYGVSANGILTKTPSINQFTAHNYILLYEN